MQFCILGLPKVGKTTLFNTLTASHEATGKFDAVGKTHVAVARVPDVRLARLRDLFQPKKFTPATVEYVDIPGIHSARARSLDPLLKTSTACCTSCAPDDQILRRRRADPPADIATLDLGRSWPTTRWSSAG
jgi:Fe2+ transport system protein B